MTTETRAAIIRLYVEERVSSVVIARAFNTTPASVHRVLKAAGIQPRTRTEARALRTAAVEQRNNRRPTRTP